MYAVPGIPAQVKLRLFGHSKQLRSSTVFTNCNYFSRSVQDACDRIM